MSETAHDTLVSGRGGRGSRGGHPVKVGVMIFATDQTLPLHRLAPEVEDRGFESLWVTDKTHVPASRRTPWPGGPELPEHYKRTCAPLVALAAAAAVTGTLRVGTGILLAAVRDPVILAKEIATLDWMSGGRVELGIAYGWNAEEHATHGVDLTQAREILADKVALMSELWNNDEASHESGCHRSRRRRCSAPSIATPNGSPTSSRTNPDRDARCRHRVGGRPTEGRRDAVPVLVAAYPTGRCR